MNTVITKAMVFAAGLGTRLKPFTDIHPKALFKVNGSTLLERNIAYLKRYGINDIVINVHHFAEQIIDYVALHNSWGIKITFSDESDFLLDTGGGLFKARPLLEDAENMVLYNADILTDLPLDKMMDFHLLHQPMATLSVSDRKSSRYFLFDSENRLSGWENIVSGEQKIKIHNIPLQQKAFSGIHIIHRSLFNTRDAIEKLSITDWYLELCKDQTILGYNDSTSTFIDVGKPASLGEAEKLLNSQD